MLLTATALALAAAVSLGLARFSYALLLPPMRAELGWSYLTAGAMNTANAAGYLGGALVVPLLLRRLDARRLMLAGGAVSGVLLAAHGAVRDDTALLVLRALTGATSAASFIAGGLLAARLSATAAAPGRRGPGQGQVLGLYYGGTGFGIVAAAVLLPPLPWPAGWAALGATALVATVLTAVGTRDLAAPVPDRRARAAAPLQRLAWALGGYALFGLGYIGYMTFAVTLLRERGLSQDFTTGFFLLLGLGVVGSSWLWAPLLQRWRGGQTMALLNALLALATLLPVLSVQPLALLASGLLFGSVFLSVVASTTALVRHNLPPAAWPAGIGAFTIVFAAGQIVGPSLVGLLADGRHGLAGGFVVSAVLLGAGGLAASRQRPLPMPP